MDAVSKTPLHDIVIVTGDFNTKVGNNNKGVTRQTGKHSLCMMNKKGRLFLILCLLEFCEHLNLGIVNTFFPHRDVHNKRLPFLTNAYRFDKPFVCKLYVSKSK